MLPQDSPAAARRDALRAVGTRTPSWGSADALLGAASPEGLREESSPVPLCCSLRADCRTAVTLQNLCNRCAGARSLAHSG